MARSRTLEALEAQATKKGYQRGAHRKDDDEKKGVAKHVSKTIKEHDRMLHRYVRDGQVRYPLDFSVLIRAPADSVSSTYERMRQQVVGPRPLKRTPAPGAYGLASKRLTLPREKTFSAFTSRQARPKTRPASQLRMR